MKKVIFGCALLLAGAIGSALLLAAAGTLEWTVNGEFSAIWNLSRYGLMPALLLFSLLAAAGLLLAVVGLFERER